MNTTQRPLFNSAYLRLMAFELFAQFGIFLLYPVVTNYAVSLGTSVATAGVIAAVYTGGCLVMRPFAGAVFRRCRRKSLLIAAAIIYIVTAAACGIINTVPALVVARIAAAVTFVIKSSLVVSFVALVVDRAYYGRAVGLVTLCSVVASAAMPIVAQQIGASAGYRWVALLAAAAWIVALVVAFTLPNPAGPAVVDADEGAKHGERDVRSDGGEDGALPRAKRGGRWSLSKMFYVPTIPLASISSLLKLVYSMIFCLLLLVGEQRGDASVSLFFAAYVVTALATRPFTSAFFDRYGFAVIMAPCTVALCATSFTLMMFEGATAYAVAGVLMALGEGAVFPCLQAECMRPVPDDHTAMASNTLYFGNDVGMTIGPLIGGVVLEVWGAQALFGLCLAGAVAYGGCYYAYYFWQKRKAAR